VSDDDVQYEYRILYRVRNWYRGDHDFVRAGHNPAGWSEWYDWTVLTTNRGEGYPYPTLLGAKRVAKNQAKTRSNHSHTFSRETETRIQRRPVRTDWEDVPEPREEP
jgi:hypothetical protein